ncbi:hypothetical protein R3P38DRAFT_2808768 [Favolaschia claudopus]|uniref:Uncharacterized protein n=1 Tax=Favolaschia claudopus TaxID=2862362 RepID=A0AAV9ZFX1_9AGAR
MCPKWSTNHGSVPANGLTGLVDVLYGLERKPLELKRLNGARRVDYHRVSDVLARFRDIDFNGTDVKVSDPTPPTEFTKIQNFFGSFGKEIEEHAIQQGSARVNNGMQQDIGELATHSSPLSTQYNQSLIVFKAAKPIQDRVVPVKWTRLSPSTNSQSQCLVMEQSLGDMAWNTEGDAERLAILPENAVPHSLQKVPKSAGIRWNSGGHWQRGREFGGAPIQTPPNPTDLVEFGGARGIGRGKQSDPPKAKTKTESYSHQQGLIRIATHCQKKIISQSQGL